MNADEARLAVLHEVSKRVREEDANCKRKGHAEQKPSEKRRAVCGQGPGQVNESTLLPSRNPPTISSQATADAGIPPMPIVDQNYDWMTNTTQSFDHYMQSNANQYRPPESHDWIARIPARL